MIEFEKNSLCAVIAAAGNSSRMKSPKAFLKYDEKITFIEKIVEEFINFGCQEIVVVVNQENFDMSCNLLLNINSKIKVIMNNRLDFERFYSIKLGLKALSNYSYCFIQNCDNPFITKDILTKIYENKEKDSFVQPTYNSAGGHPILISKYIGSHITKSIQNDANLKFFLSAFRAKKVELDSQNILFNINTTADYQQISKILKLT